VRSIQNNETYTTGQQALSILAGWTAPEQTGLTADDRWDMVAAALRSAGCANPRRMPCHRSLAAQAAELADEMERDAAARATFTRRSAR